MTAGVDEIAGVGAGVPDGGAGVAVLVGVIVGVIDIDGVAVTVGVLVGVGSTHPFNPVIIPNTYTNPSILLLHASTIQY